LEVRLGCVWDIHLGAFSGPPRPSRSPVAVRKAVRKVDVPVVPSPVQVDVPGVPSPPSRACCPCRGRRTRPHTGPLYDLFHRDWPGGS